MKYKKKQDTVLDESFSKAARHGMNIRFGGEYLFYRKGFHWEYIDHKDVARIYRRVEEVISHTSCCAENMDIEKLIVIGHDGNETTVHVCDGERRLAEKLYSDINEAWSDVAFGKA